MATPKPIEFNGWQDGMKNHPINGLGLVKNVDIFENSGIAKIQNRMVDSGLVYTALPGAEVYDTYGNTWTLTGGYGLGTGTLYKNTLAVETGITNAWDIKIYKDYVFVSHADKVAAYGPISSGPQYFDDLLTSADGLVDEAFGALLVGQDDFLYRGNGNFVTKIEVTAASSGTPPTVAISTSLDLPDGQYVTCMAVLGTNIMIGTCGSPAYADRYTLPTANIYPWNRQAGTLGNAGLADLPIILNENSINSIISHANRLYVSAGVKGNIYEADGVNYRKIATIPYAKYNYTIDSIIYVNAMSVYRGTSLLVGVSGSNSTVATFGLYEVNISNPKYPISFRDVSDPDSNVTYVGFLNNKTDTVIRAGWWDGTGGGGKFVDETDSVVYQSYSAIIETELQKVAMGYTKRTFQHIEINLADALEAGQGIKVSYRSDSSSDFTLLSTWTFTTRGAVSSIVDSFPIADIRYLQLKIELDQGSGVTSGKNVSLISVFVW